MARGALANETEFSVTTGQRQWALGKVFRSRPGRLATGGSHPEAPQDCLPVEVVSFNEDGSEFHGTVGASGSCKWPTEPATNSLLPDRSYVAGSSIQCRKPDLAAPGVAEIHGIRGPRARGDLPRPNDLVRTDQDEGEHVAEHCHVPRPALGQPDLPVHPSPTRHQKYRVSRWIGCQVSHIPYSHANPEVGPKFGQLYFAQAVREFVELGHPHQEAALSRPRYPDLHAGAHPLAQRRGGKQTRTPDDSADALKAYSWASRGALPPAPTPRCLGRVARPECQLYSHTQFASVLTSVAPEMGPFKPTVQRYDGIHSNLSQVSFNTVIAELSRASPCRFPTNSNWQPKNRGDGCPCRPEFYPTGRSIFEAGAGINEGPAATQPTTSDLPRNTCAAAQPCSTKTRDISPNSSRSSRSQCPIATSRRSRSPRRLLTRALLNCSPESRPHQVSGPVTAIHERPATW